MTTTESLDMIQVLYGIRQMYMQVWETAEKRFSIGVPVQELFDWCKHEYAEKDTFLERVIEDFKQVHSAQSDLQQTCNQLATDCISRQAAIELAMQYCPDDDGSCSKADRDIRELLDDLESLPPAQPKPDEWCTDCKEYDPEEHCCPRFNRFIRNALKDAQPEKKKGKWIVHPEVKNVYGGTYIECSQCGEKYVVQHMEDEKYCRNCGAKMEE